MTETIRPGGRLTLEDLPDLVEAVREAVVYVGVTGAEVQGNGSGFSIPVDPRDAARGIVVTNAHVVSGAERCFVRFADELEVDARVRVIDESTDLAILDLPQSPARTLELRPLAQVRVGEPVMAIGSPFGIVGTVTTGIVSGLNRTMPAPNGIPIDNLVQSDALVNPGNSGGPLIGLDGRVIGVNAQVQHSAALHGPSGLGYAIPSDTVAAVYSEICETGESRIRRAAIGVRLRLRQFGNDERLSLGQRTGAVLIDEPTPDTPAARAGLRRGDVILRLDDVPVDDPASVFRLLDRTRIGRECALVYVRGGESQQAAITPNERQ